MRELRGAGVVKVAYIPTDENTSDLFTKILHRQPFEKHRKVTMNLAAGGGLDKAVSLAKALAAAGATAP